MTRRDRPFWTCAFGTAAAALALAASGAVRVWAQTAFKPGPDASAIAPPAGAAANAAAMPAPASPAAPPRGNPLWGIPLGDLSATRDRPMFSPSRRPPAPAVVAAAAAVTMPAPPPPPKAERPALVLVGTIVGETRKFAVFTDETTQKIIHLEIGEEHGGWILRLVTSAEARLETAHQAVTLALRPPGGESAKGSEAVAATALVPPVRHRKR